MKTVQYTTIVCLFLPLLAYSQQVSVIEAQKAAVSAIKSEQNRGNYNLSFIEKVNTIKSDTTQDTLLYEVIFPDNEAVLLSGYKSCEPILGYYTLEDTSIFVQSKVIPAGLKNMIEEYANQIGWAFSNNLSDSTNYSKWQNLQNQNLTRASASVIIAPLIPTFWGQYMSNDGDCVAYNYYVNHDNNSCNDCPTDKCPVGCTAVAMGQIMKYWNYPVYRQFREYQYDWCNMPDGLYSNNNPNYIDERHNIARLLKDCAVSVNAFYCVFGTCSTSAALLSVPNAMEDVFAYSEDMHWALKSSYSWRRWKDSIRDNLNNGKPVLYTSPGMRADGHVFICDGYRSDDTYHFNWGWNGSYHYSWFALNALKVGTHNYKYAQEAVFNIYPADSQDFCDFSLQLWMHYAIHDNHYSFPSMYPSEAPLYHNVPKVTHLMSAPEYIGNYTTDASWRTIPAGVTAEYVAHKSVEIVPGFDTEIGANFTIRIEPCDACYNTQSSQVMANVPQNNPIVSNDFIKELTLEEQQEEKTPSLQNENNIEKQIILHPNPNNGTFSIDANFDLQEIIQLQIFNEFGKLIYNQNTLSRTTIQLPSSEKGLFIVKITTKFGNFTQKMLVQ